MHCNYCKFLLICIVVFIASHPARSQDCERQEESVEQGRKCRKQCNSNKDCNNRKKRTCVCDDLCGMSCVAIEDDECESPGNIENGQVQYSNFFKYKSVAEYSCDKGYILEGKKERECRSDGGWSGKSPTCKQSACKYPARISVAFAETDQTVFSVGDKVKYSCRYGYILSGNEEVTCQDDNAWSVPDFLCTKVSCGDPGEPLNGYVEAEDFKFGSWASYKCDAGYEISKPTRARRYCSTTGKWSGEPISCLVKSCGTPTAPDHGDANARTYEFQSIVTYSCNRGYILEGNQEGDCDENGSWGDMPTCRVDVDCDFDSGERPICGYYNRGETEWRRQFLRESTRGNLPGYVLTYDGTGDSSAVLLSPSIPSTNAHCLQFYYYATAQIAHEDVYIKVNAVKGSILVDGIKNPESRWVGFQATLQPSQGEFDIKFEIVAQGRTKLSIDDVKVMKNECADPCRDANCQNGGICVGEIETFYCSCTEFYTGHFCGKEITCEKPSWIQFGKIIAPDVMRFKSRISYSCSQGFKLKGASFATCGRDGQLSEKLPSCEREFVYEGECPKGYKLHKLMCYGFYTEQVTYSEAVTKCVQDEARLAVVQSEQVHDYLYDSIPSRSNQRHTYWIGLVKNGGVSKWSSDDEFKEINDMDYAKPSRKRDACGAYYYRGLWVGGVQWYIYYPDCNSRQRFICEKWSKAADSFKVTTANDALSGIYRPVAGLLTKHGEQIHRNTKGGSTYLFYQHGSKWGWYIGDYYMELSKPGPWSLMVKSYEQFPYDIKKVWHDFNENDVDVSISVADLWTTWSGWQCEVTCGTGQASRFRTCQENGAGSLNCKGPDEETKQCQLQACPMAKVDPEYEYHHTINGFTYVFMQNYVNKEGAKRSCAEKDMQLAIVRDKAAHDALIWYISQIRIVKKNPKWAAYWINGERRGDGKWIWGDGTEINEQDQHWEIGRPDGQDNERVTCIEIGEGGGRTGWNDLQCHHGLRYICEKEVDASHCSNKPCKNGGKCNELPADYDCKCTEGYTGKNCELVNPCFSDPCVQGNCRLTKEGYHCFCTNGYSGKNCDIPPIKQCEPNPCQNGYCVDKGADYECTCQDGFGGRNCDQELPKDDPCEPNPCKNGNCRVLDKTFTCFCSPEFTGRLCDQDARAGCRVETISKNVVVKLSNGFPLQDKTVAVGTEIQLACSDPEKTVVGQRKMKCKGNGQWSRRPDITCAQNTSLCTMELFPSNMDTYYGEGTKVEYLPLSIEPDSFLRFECNPSEFEGGGDFYCKDGEWEMGLPFQCVNKITCPHVARPKNGWIEVNPRNGGPPYTDGVEVIFKCNPYYKRTAAPKITCGRDGKWSDIESKCKETGCLLFDFDLNSGVSVKNKDGDIQAEKGEKFKLICDNGKSLKIECKGKDVWEPSYTDFQC